MSASRPISSVSLTANYCDPPFHLHVLLRRPLGTAFATAACFRGGGGATEGEGGAAVGAAAGAASEAAAAGAAAAVKSLSGGRQKNRLFLDNVRREEMLAVGTESFPYPLTSNDFLLGGSFKSRGSSINNHADRALHWKLYGYPSIPSGVQQGNSLVMLNPTHPLSPMRTRYML